MPAPKGNKYALGNSNSGRPREVSFSPEEMIQLGEEMVQWCLENKPMHLCQWYQFEKDFTDKQWDTFRKCEEFFHYYTKALRIVGMQYLDKDSTVDVRIKDRWQRVYFKDLRHEEDETKRFESSLKKEENREISQDLIDRHDAFNKQIDALRKERDKLKNGS